MSHDGQELHVVIPVQEIQQFFGLGAVMNVCLTHREKQVLDLLLKGKSNKEAGVVLCIGTGTIKFHVLNIYRKLGISGRLDLLEYFASKKIDRLEAIGL